MKVLIHRMSSNYRILKSRCKLEDVDNQNVIRGIAVNAKQGSSLQKFTSTYERRFKILILPPFDPEEGIRIQSRRIQLLLFKYSIPRLVSENCPIYLRLRFERDKKKQR